MSWLDCVNRAVRAGVIPAERAVEAERLYRQQFDEHVGAMGEAAAALQAEGDMLRMMRSEALEARRRRLLGLQAQTRLAASLESYGDGSLRAQAEGAVGLIDDIGMFEAGRSIEGRRAAILGRAHGRMSRVLETFRRDLAGRTRNRAQLANLTREAFGQRSGDSAARALNEAWQETAEFLRRAYVEAGGVMPKMQRWGLPQSHDWVTVRAAKYQPWRDFVWQRLDRDRMIDWRTERPMSDAELEIALREAFETISNQGWNKVQPSGAIQARGVATRRSDHRFLQFRDGDAWLEYADKFGDGDPFQSMLAYVAGMSRDIAQMQVFGPNPTASLRFVQQKLRQDARLKGVGADMERADRVAKRLESLMEHYTGAANEPVNTKFAAIMQGTRNVLTSAQLGAATLSAVTDVNFGRMAAKHAGLDQARLIARLAKLLDPRNAADRELAVRLGLVAESWSSVASAQARYVGEISGPEWSQTVSDAVLRVSGLSAWTQAGRHAFGMEFMGTLADYRGSPFKQLPEPLRTTLDRYGLGESAWEAIRATPVFSERGATFLRPDDVAARTDLTPARADDLATKILQMIASETEFAVPATSLRGRELFLSGQKPGTLGGEILRSTVMYKNFAITLAYTHMARIGQQTTGAGKLRYGAGLLISTTLMGALAIQLKEISKGRDPRAMVEGDASSMAGFWGAAMMQGGGLGIFGDFFLADQNRFGGGFAQTLAGPVAAAIADASRLTVGNAYQLAQGQDTAFGHEALKFVKRYTPGASLWYGRLAVERTLDATIAGLIDPDAARRRRRAEKKLRKDTGQKLWWRSGEALPDRAPDPTAILGDLK